MPQDKETLLDRAVESQSGTLAGREDPWVIFAKLMEAIASGRVRQGSDDENEGRAAGLGISREIPKDWLSLYKKSFCDRKYPRAQAFLNTEEARSLLPNNYVYGTSVFLKYDPLSVRLLHLLDSSRFLYFQTDPTWSKAQWRHWQDSERRRELLSWRKSTMKRGAISGELRQLASKYQTLLTQAGVLEEKPDLVSPALGLRYFFDRWLQWLEKDVIGERPENRPLDTAFADFSLLDLFDLAFLLQLRDCGQRLRDFVKETSLLAEQGGSFLRRLSPSDEAFKLFLPEWVGGEGLIDEIVTFPVACQGFDEREEGADDVLFVGFFGKKAPMAEAGQGPTPFGGDPTLRALVSLITSTSLNELRRIQVLAEARHSAVAAIMGRNLSHNIGSHVLHWMIRRDEEIMHELRDSVSKPGALGSRPRDLLDAEITDLVNAIPHRVYFLRYLRERMDYIATVTRRLAWWSYSSPLSVLIAPLRTAKGSLPQLVLLLRNIGRSDGIKLVTVAERQGEWPSFQRLNIALPHGAAGRQAFFTILENIVRNSAKHQPARDDIRNFTLGIEEEPEYPDHVRVIVTDGETRADEATTLRMNRALQDPICDPQGRPKMKQLGFKEMRISAAFLRMIQPDEADDFHEPDLIALEARNGYLAHVFYMLKSFDLLFVTTMAGKNRAAWKRLRDFGIGVILPGEEALLAALRYRFTVLLDEDDEEVCTWADGAFGPDHLLPVRSFRIHSLPQKEEGCRIRAEEGHRISELLHEALDAEGSEISRKLKQEVYDLWLRYSFGKRADVQVAVFGLGDSWVGECVNGLASDHKLFDQGNGGGAITDRLRNLLTDNSKFDPNKPIAVLAHHGTLSDLEEACRDSKVVFAQGWSGSSATGGFLMQNPEPSAREFLLRELQETVLSRVLIIDERLASDPPHSEVRRMFSCAGVELIGQEFLDLVAADPEVRIEWPLWRRGPQFDYASIHFGLIEKSAKKLKMPEVDVCTEAILRKLAEISRVVLVHSGRGRPVLPSSVPGIRYLDFSSLASWFTEDKRTLVIGLGGV